LGPQDDLSNIRGSFSRLLCHSLNDALSSFSSFKFNRAGSFFLFLLSFLLFVLRRRCLSFLSLSLLGFSLLNLILELCLFILATLALHQSCVCISLSLSCLTLRTHWTIAMTSLNGQNASVLQDFLLQVAWIFFSNHCEQIETLISEVVYCLPGH